MSGPSANDARGATPTAYRLMRSGGALTLFAAIVGIILGGRRLGHSLMAIASLAFLLWTVPSVRARPWSSRFVVVVLFSAIIASAIV